MNKKIGSSNKALNVIAPLVILLITTGALYCTYYIPITTPIKAVVWILWLIISLLVASFTSKGKQAIAFIKESKIEMQKVVWPNRQETVQTTTIVIVMVAITGFVLWGVDNAMMWAIGKITHLG